MSWPTVIWSMTAAICLTLGVTHFRLWLWNRQAWVNLAFFVAAASVSAIALLELSLMYAQTPEAFATIVRWGHLPVFFMVAALVAFVRLYLQAGRLWLAHAVWGVRLVSLIINFVVPTNLNYVEITNLEHVEFLGQSVAVADGVYSSWTRVGELSSLLWLVFVLDASIACWRRGDPDSRYKAVTIGGSIVLFILVAGGFGMLLHRGAAKLPYLISFPFLGMVLVIAYERSRDVFRAGELSQRLGESEQRMELASQAAGLSTWTWDSRRGKIQATPRFCALLGFTSTDELDFTEFLARIHPDDRAAAEAVMQHALATGGEFHIEFRTAAPADSEKWISAIGTAAVDGRGETTLLRGVCIDVTEPKRSDERFRLVVQGAPTGIIVSDPRGHIVLVNPKAESMLGYAAAELLGESIDRLVPERVRDTHLDHRGHYLISPQARSMGDGRELGARRKDGTELPVEIALTPIRTSEEMYVLTSLVDVSERRRAESEIQLLRSEIAHVGRVSVMGELAATLAHELGQPLGAILRNAEAAELFVAGDPPNLDEVMAILQDICEDDRRAVNIIARMRSLMKRGDLDLVEVRLTEIVKDVVAITKADASARDVRIQVDVQDEGLFVRGDRVHLQQVLLNLMLNGMDAMRAVPAAARRLAVRARRLDDEMAEVAVADVGHGIGEGTLTKVFEPFYTTKSNGMGMGLAICRTLVEEHGGRIWVQNNPEGGATFRFTVPLALPSHEGDAS